MRNTRLLSLVLFAGIALGAAPLSAQEGQPTRSARGWLGFSYGISSTHIVLQRQPPEMSHDESLVIGEVLKGSPADRAGMEPGDSLVKVNGEAATLRRMSDASRRLHPGDTVRLEVRRAGKSQTLTLVAAQRPAYMGPDLPMFNQMRIAIDGDSIRRTMRLYLDSARLRLDSLPFPRTIMRHDSMLIMEFGNGRRPDTIRLPRMDSAHWQRMRVLGDSMFRHMPNVRVYTGRDFPEGMPGFDIEVAGRRGVAGAAVQELNSQLAAYFGVREGLLVEEVSPGTPAAKAGLQAGDVVTAAAGRSVGDVADLRRAVRGREGAVKIEVVRKGKKQELQLKWP